MAKSRLALPSSADTLTPTTTARRKPWVDWTALSAIKRNPNLPPEDDEPELERRPPWRAPLRRGFERRGRIGERGA